MNIEKGPGKAPYAGRTPHERRLHGTDDMLTRYARAAAAGGMRGTQRTPEIDTVTEEEWNSLGHDGETWAGLYRLRGI